MISTLDRGLIAFAVWLSIMLGVQTWVVNKRVQALELLHKEVVLENIFLAHKLGESVHEYRNRFAKVECQTDLAVSGFRTGHYRAYRMMRTGALESCNTLQEVYLD